ncbi:PPOX class F420-dependent oxidoreductase [Ktedonospora formicarum]|uniref:PPOX class F420-dependent enzyme n=1 Tax=Ktedonospora formicarum TaxID=2778364 RepID=A0A8J3MS38_9CHLR|nr:PPOX class F420-dependent oxidoreductase [Ktedonospora formicarum]GHO44456.1 PPOX class F420-dependent enzyme [Ktedonospora formicarum]
MKTKNITPQVRSFLLDGTRTGKIATVRSDHRPHVVPVWFNLDGDEIVFTTGKDSLKAKNLRRDGLVAMCVDDEHPPYAYVEIEGNVSFSEDSKELLIWATRIGGRYMGQEHARDYGQRNSAPGEVVVRIHPQKVLFEEKVAE